MKKTVTALAMLALMPLSSFAISLEELQNNPAKYVKIQEDISSTYYLEPATIKVLRSSFPYLTLQSKVYTVLYPGSFISESLYTTNYDEMQSLYSLTLIKRANTPNATDDELVNYAIEEAKKDSGVSYSVKADYYYDFDGNLLSKGAVTPLGSGKVPFQTVLYALTNHIYYYHTQCKYYFFAGVV